MNSTNDSYFSNPPFRVYALDVLRGIGIIGILLLNIVAFALHRAYHDPTNAGGSIGWDLDVWWLNNIFIEGSMRGILSFVFGAGIIYYSQQNIHPAEVKIDLFYRKMGWLFLFGLIHSYLLLWYGDFLYTYSIVGMFAYILRHWTAKKLFILSSIIVCVATILNIKDYVQAKQIYENYQTLQRNENFIGNHKKVLIEWTALIKKYKTNTEELKEVKKNLSGNYFEILWYHSDLVKAQHTSTFYRKYFLDVLAMVLLGMGFVKNGLFNHLHSIRYYIYLTTIGYIIGIGINYWESYYLLDNHFTVLSFSLTDTTQEIGRIATTIGHIGFILLLLNSKIAQPIFFLFSKIGKMALSNYILQTLICNFIFMGYGLNWFGTLNRHELYYIVPIIWFVQFLFSFWWLKHFNYGPLEWLWKTLTFGKIINNNNNKI